MRDGDKTRSLRRKAIAAFLFCAVLTFLSGCNKGTTVDGKAQKGYSKPEIMIVAMAEKNLYEEVCTNQIWEVSVPGEDRDFASYLTEQIRSFMEEMKIMNLLAQERNISLTSEERSDMSKAAKEYYGSLTKEDIAYMGLTEEDVRTVYEDYCLANKLVEELTKNVNLEVSDSEAKVISIRQVEFDSSQAAESFLQAASQENADFDKCAEEAGVTVTVRQLGREEESQAFEDAAFSLVTDQISGVLSDGGTFFVLKCVSDYDEEATLDRKNTIYEERKRKAFREIYDEYKASVNLAYSGDPFKELDLKNGEYAKGADFFKIYQSYEQK